jgi:low affinity Fe/Cu permease
MRALRAVSGFGENTTMSDQTTPQPGPREPRPPASRFIDRFTDALGDEKTFAAAVIVVTAAVLVGALMGRLVAVSSIATLVTFVMVFAVQHTSSRESRALNIKIDELLRVSAARNDLIGAEDETHSQLDDRRQELLEERDDG